MSLKDFSIDTNGCVWKDEKSKSLSYFSKSETVFCSAKIIDQLKQLSAKNNNVNVRICLHTSPDETLQNMVLLAKMGVYYQPHVHKFKSESYHIIEGGLAYFEFDMSGNIVDAIELAVGDILRVGKNTIHVTLPLQDPTLFHETAVGPFDAKLNMETPDWVPAPEDKEKVKEFLVFLINAIPSCSGKPDSINKYLNKYQMS